MGQAEGQGYVVSLGACFSGVISCWSCQSERCAAFTANYCDGGSLVRSVLFAACFNLVLVGLCTWLCFQRLRVLIAVLNNLVSQINSWMLRWVSFGWLRVVDRFELLEISAWSPPRFLVC